MTGATCGVAAAVAIVLLATSSSSCTTCRAVSLVAPPAIRGTLRPGQLLTAFTGTWRGTRVSNTFQWWRCDADHRGCAAIAGAKQAAYRVAAADVGKALYVVVAATGQDRAVASSARSAVTAPIVATAAGVGAPGPAVICTATLEPGANVEAALLKAIPGSTVCLNGGDWSDPHLSSINPSSTVTLAAAPGQIVRMSGLTMGTPAGVSNLTVQGIYFTGGVRGLDAISGNLILQYNTLEKFAGYAFYFYGNGNGGDKKQSGVTIRYNQIDHVSECLESVDDTTRSSDFHFDQNVCGPDIGYGQISDAYGGQYVQIGGWDSGSIDNNAFEGPADPSNARLGEHLNVIHGNGGSTELDISKNIFWHTDPLPSNVRLQSGPQTNITIDNNLEVDNVGEAGSRTPEGFVVNSVRGLRFNHNTVVNAFWGATYIGPPCTDSRDCYSRSTNMTGEYNISVPVMGAGSNPNYWAWDCSSGCTTDHNVSADSSASSALGGSPNVTNWTARFVTTVWSPHSGSPWSPPPDGYYQPVGLPWPAGSRGTIGP